MEFRLQPLTKEGAKLVSLAEEHAPALADRAGEHDRASSFPFESFEEMRESGLLKACVPVELGGLGVDSAHDVAVGMGRLAQGDGATALGANMHLTQVWLLSRFWKSVRDAGAKESAERLEGFLRRLASGQVLISSTVAEAGTDILHPHLQAVEAPGGWILNGRKSFGTLTPAAQLLQVTCRVTGKDGQARFAVASVPKGSPGVDVRDNWDALGMRASGSNDVVFKDCFVPEGSVSELGPWGQWSEPYLTGNIVITLGLVAVFLGIAESARDHVVRAATSESGRKKSDKYSIRHLVAQLEIDLAASRAMLSRTGVACDDLFRRFEAGSTPVEELHALMKDFQCTKWFVTRKAIDIVDGAMTLSGGSGYLSKSPLSRLYRDVRAGPFMQPFSPKEAFEYIGRVTLGLPPDLGE
jgi:alkylation response protein AidB-like acyl-CoA dehydrogenase